jgi:hypothetical protein
LCWRDHGATEETESIGVMQLNLSTSKLSTLSVSVSSFQKDVEKVVVTAYAAALADAYNFKKTNGCLAYVNAGGCIWTEGHPDEKFYCAGCEAVAYSEGAVDSKDAVAAAGVLLFSLHLIVCMLWESFILYEGCK